MNLTSPQFSPRHPNAAKAMANWEKKSAYLLREIVKFKTYVDSLKAAQQQKEVIEKEREERAAEKAALYAKAADDGDSAHVQAEASSIASSTSSPELEMNHPVIAMEPTQPPPPPPPQTAQSV